MMRVLTAPLHVSGRALRLAADAGKALAIIRRLSVLTGGGACPAGRGFAGDCKEQVATIDRSTLHQH